MNDLISVIVPVYNAEQYIDRCIKSIQNNTYKNIEIILVNDGSNDNSGKICDKYAKEDDRIVVIHKKNAGTAAARNDALDIAKGEYIAFCDNDDYISPFFYEYMLKAIKADDADVVVCEMTRENDKLLYNQETNYICEAVNKHDFILGTYTGDWTRNTAPWNKMYKKQLFDKIRFPAGKGYEDAYTTYRLLFQANKIIYINQVMYCWYMNTESYSSLKDNPMKLFFREEAIRLQTIAYNDETYKDVKNAAICFYINQIAFMVWQLDHDYIKNNDCCFVRQSFLKKLKRYFKKYGKLLQTEDYNRIYEYLHPHLSAINNKLFKGK